ncbi:unnamed protein product [Hermetia illucens]|uniref:C2H2-type domain-containing protein n=1 Tax=Hermetia illucens TaxID=343691 RepID=A0A7R8UGU9_HERIL|nr:zinc finger protein 431-like [Hermetia illucens]CAD7080455.1 unnamed protein product [Hermetia illucens]
MNADDTKYICLPAVDIKTEYEPKEEILDETLVSYGLSYPGSDPTSGHETKCGSIFLSVERTYIFVCEYCCARFGDMGSLGVHLENVHFDYIKQEDFRLETVPKEEADPDCDTIEDEAYPEEQVPSTDITTTSTDTPSTSAAATPPAPTKTKPYACKECNSQYSTRKAYVRHMKQHGLPETQTPPQKRRDVVYALQPDFDEEKNFCNTCNLQFETKRLFRNHKIAHLDRNRKEERAIETAQLTCELCGCQLTSAYKFRAHLATTHGDEIPTSLQGDASYLKCLFCHLKFEKPTTRFVHEESHNTEEKPYRCSVCPETFARANQRQTHESIHSLTSTSAQQPKALETKNQSKFKTIVVFALEPSYDEERNFCNTCNRQLDSKSAMMNHKKAHNWKIRQQSDDRPKIEQFPCELCDRQLTSAYRFRSHVATMHGDEIPKSLQGDPAYLKCLFCHLDFEKPTVRFQHEQTHNTEDKPYRCSMCPKAFMRWGDRKTHEAVHQRKPFICPHCPNMYKTRLHLRTHINGAHTQTDTKQYPCEYCGKLFESVAERKFHVRTHKKQILFECDECDAKYGERRNLLLHKKRHQNNQDEKCEICGKFFLTKNHLKDHMIISHSDKPAYKCSHCDKEFLQKRSFIGHLRVHNENS